MTGKRIRTADATNERCRRMVSAAEELGFEVYRRKGGHLCYRHPNGALAFGPSTPSSWRQTENQIRKLTRLAGQEATA